MKRRRGEEGTTQVVPFDPNHRDTCKVCGAARVDTVAIPCGHAFMCHRCGPGYAGRACVLCQRNVESMAQKPLSMSPGPEGVA
ncbi:unnamed protein product [Scytosiphon promiscuus]